MPDVIVNFRRFPQVDERGEECGMATDSRASMVRSAASLIGTRGLNATSLADILADSGAPRGSIYHHFPDGKTQLAEDAVRWTSDRVLAYQRACPATSPAEVLNCFIGMWRQVVQTSQGRSGCVVAGVAVDSEESADSAASSDAEPDGGLMAVVRSTFRAWVDLLSEQLQATGVPADRARPIALAVLAGMEGALILCRAEGSAAPLDEVAEQLLRLLP
jgi:TetR/AcrR family transcriptional regulator, lmrAB and yxaGH operons repressor